MKCITKIYRLFYFILFLGFFHLSSNAQTFLNKHYLSDDVENLINSNPDQALKIAQYLLSKTNTSNTEKAKVNYLISKSYLVKGDYSSALNFLYEEKNYEDYLSDLQKIDIQICKVTLLRELSLDKQAKRILKKLEVTSKTISDDKLKSYLETSINIQNAKFLSKENKNKEGIDLIENQAATKKDFLLEYRELQLNQIITLGQLFLNQNDLEKSKEQFENAITIINELNDNNIFTKIDALQGMASIAFLKKDHNQVVILLD
jgi:hypothetical protein